MTKSLSVYPQKTKDETGGEEEEEGKAFAAVSAKASEVESKRYKREIE